MLDFKNILYNHTKKDRKGKGNNINSKEKKHTRKGNKERKVERK